VSGPVVRGLTIAIPGMQRLLNNRVVIRPVKTMDAGENATEDVERTAGQKDALPAPGAKRKQPRKMVIDPNKRLNELSGRDWIRYSISIWDIAKTGREQKYGHPAMFPLELCGRLISTYTKEGHRVLDPFLGSGSTLVAAQTLNRQATGFEVNEKFIKLTKGRLSQRQITDLAREPPKIIRADAREIGKYLAPDSVDFVLTSPPYWDILRQKRTADYKAARPYSETEIDLGNIDDYGAFIGELKKVFSQVFSAVRPNRFCAVVVMDLRKGDRFYPFHMDLTRMMEDIGWVLDDIIVWDRRKEYNNLRALGYPYVFRVNKVHEFIMIYQKRKAAV